MYNSFSSVWEVTQAIITVNDNDDNWDSEQPICIC